MKRLMTIGVMVGALAVALSAQAAKPTIMLPREDVAGSNPPKPNAINGTVFFPLAGTVDDYIIQHEVDGEWVTVTNLKAVYHSMVEVNYIQTTDAVYRGVSRWRVAFADPAPETDDDWLVVTIDARNPLSGTPIGTPGYNGDENGSGAHNAFDGDLSSMYHSADADRFAGWVGLDLGESKYIDRVAFVPRHEWNCGIYGNTRVGLAEFQVANSSDFSDAQTFHAVKQEDCNQSAYFYSFDCDRVGYGRYVRCLSPVDYLNTHELEFSEGIPPTSDNDPSRSYLREEPYAINGRAYFPIQHELNPEYVLQRYDETKDAWISLTTADYEEKTINNDYLLIATNLFVSGVTKWRLGRATILNCDPLSWNEFTLDARNPVPLAELTPFACKWDEFDPGNNKYGQTPTNSFDGNFETTFHPSDAQAYQYEQFIGADLGRERTVYAVTVAPIFNYRNGNERLRNSRVTISDTGDFTDAEVVYTMNNSESWGSEELYTFEFEKPVTTRYIRLEFGEHSGWFNPAEFEIDVLDESDTSTHLKAEVADFSTGYPKLTFVKRYSEEGKVAIYRSNLATGPWAQVGEVDTGVGSWIETDEKMKYGREYFYKVGSDIVSYRRVRRLDQEAAAVKFIDWRGYEDDLQIEGNNNSQPDYRRLFDGDTSTKAWLIVNTEPWYLNPAIGLDFSASGKKAHVAFYRQYMGETLVHSVFVRACGANSLQDVTAAPKPISNEPNGYQVYNTLRWHKFQTDSSEAFSYVYLYQPTIPALEGNNAWCGSMYELEFYGWYDTDLVTPGFTILIR